MPSHVDQEQARGRVVAVIMQERPFFEQRQWRLLALVDDAARLFVKALVVFVGVPFGDQAERAAQHRRFHQACLETRHQRVAAE